MLAETVQVQQGLRWWKLVVEGLEDWADQDPRRDPRQRVVVLERLSGVCQVLESVIVLGLGDSGRARSRLVRKRVWPLLDVRSDLAGRRERIIALLP